MALGMGEQSCNEALGLKRVWVQLKPLAKGHRDTIKAFG